MSSSIGAAIRRKREEAGLSVRDVVSTWVGPSEWKAIESGVQQVEFPEEITAICTGLGVTWDDLRSLAVNMEAAGEV